MTSGEAIMRMIEGAQSNTSAQGLLDAQLIANKSAVSLYFVDPLQSNDLELAKTTLSLITDDLATITVAKSSLDKALGVIHVLEDNTISQKGINGKVDLFMKLIAVILF